MLCPRTGVFFPHHMQYCKKNLKHIVYKNPKSSTIMFVRRNFTSNSYQIYILTWSEKWNLKTDISMGFDQNKMCLMT